MEVIDSDKRISLLVDLCVLALLVNIRLG